MKRFLSILLVALLSIPLVAVEKSSPAERAQRDYSLWLPQEGDWSVGFSLDPLATFVGNMFNQSVNNALGVLSGEPLLSASLPSSMVSVMGSYNLTDQWSLRANVGFGYTYKNQGYYVLDDEALALDPLSTLKVIDRHIENNISGSFAFGADYRVGSTHPVQGVFGFGLVYSLGHLDNTYSYGNAITEINTKPSINTQMPTYAEIAGSIPNGRLLSSKSTDLVHTIGAYASIGVEWFVSPKVALGANVNVKLTYTINPAQAALYEGWDFNSQQVMQYNNLISPTSHGITFSTDNIGANLYVAFYLDGGERKSRQRATQDEEEWEDEDDEENAEDELESEENQDVPVYRVQVLAAKGLLDPNAEQFQGLTDCQYTIRERNGEDIYRYTYGEDTNHDNIVSLRNSLRDRFPKCFIVAFLNGEQITEAQALEMQK